MSPTPLVYFVLGTSGSGRRALLLDLLDNGREPGERAAVLLAADEPASRLDSDLAARPHNAVVRWHWSAPSFPAFALPPCETLYFVADSGSDLIDQVEALKPWLAASGCQLGGIIAVIDCRHAAAQPELRPWFEACMYYADVAVLTRREGVPNKWLSEFRRHFESECYPCLILLWKKGGLDNPALVLTPAPRRVSQYFEPDEQIEIEGLVTDDEEPDEDDEKPPEDPYIARRRGGRRERELPRPADFPAPAE